MENYKEMNSRFIFKRFLTALSLMLAFLIYSEHISAQSTNHAVGTPKGTFCVSNTGAATYNVGIDVPDGGKLTPGISINYSSQSGNGLAGYGFNISGLSCITRGCKDLFHDGFTSGNNYSGNTAFFLNGQRLILRSGSYGYTASEYSPEGDPFTRITLHGTASGSTCWFSVSAPDGKVYELGNTADSRLSFTSRNNISHVAAWYINKVCDEHNNYANYHYTTTNYNIRPINIEYGLNSTRSRGIINTISFNYNTITGTSAIPFAIGDRQGKMDVCLAHVTSSCNGHIFRKYNFSYNNTSDGTDCKYNRLVKVELENGNGESLNPINILWNYLPSSNFNYKKLNIPVKSSNSMIEEDSKTFIAVDINNDGISDIIRLSPGNYVIHSGNSTHKTGKTFLFVSLSKKDIYGNVSYGTPKQFDLPPSFSMDDLKNVIGGIQAMDFDGDGYNDLIIPYYCGYKDKYAERYTMIFGKAIINGGSIKEIGGRMVNCDHTPLLTVFDSNGDGRDDIFYLEDRAKDGYYNGAILRYKDLTSLKTTQLKLKLNKDPKKIFVGDYNSDGLTDILALYDGGYKIFFNNGGIEDSNKYSDTNSKTGTNIGDKFRIIQGDFNGDGRIDFVYHNGEWDYGLAINNGDGTFSINDKAAHLSITNQNTNKDDNRFNILAYDFDHDGKCDFVVTKANYVFHGGFRSRYYYKNTETVWAKSTGTAFVSAKDIITNQEKDAEPNNIFMGDFYGNGDVQVANFGKNLLTPNNNIEDALYTYHISKEPGSGKVSSITDGLNHTTYIYYKSGTNPSVYNQGAGSSYPVNNYTLPMPLVSSISDDGGAAGSQYIKYTYGGLKLHVAGKGMLGFTNMSIDNTTIGSKTTTTIDKWDSGKWIPLQTTYATLVDNSSSKIISTTSISDIAGTNNYFAYTSKKETTDLDGNTAETCTAYDISKGVPVQEIVKNDGNNMYKQVDYSGYVQKAGRWMPTTVVRSQKHKDDAGIFSTTTSYTYDDKGNTTATTENDGQPLKKKTVASYDTYGNVISSQTGGYGIKPIAKYNIYDTSGRFVVKTYETPSSAINTFSYDLWGNVLTENDVTNPSAILTTKNSYDNWGTLKSTVDADGTQTTYDIGWGTDNTKKYYVRKSTDNAPWVKTWYDNCGHETLSESVGINGLSITKATGYNTKGQVSRVENKNGNLTVTENLTYDGRGRVLTDVSSSGKSTSYSYGNRSVTSVVAGRSYTKTYDAWGNIVTSVDPLSKVSYTYAAVGKPGRITTNGSEVTAKYDEVGNQISLTDPDAGTSTYEYAADGKLLKETDGRGIETVNTYDELGRIASTKTGNNTVTNTYGTIGNEKLRLAKMSMGNNSIEYTHDKYGRVITEKRNVSGKGTYNFSYSYNDKNQLSKTSYPEGLDVTYLYDNYGFRTKATAGDDVIYSVGSDNGLVSMTAFKNIIRTVHILDARGYENGIKLLHGATTIESFDENYEGATGNLLSRKRNSSDTETFSYDNLDRLISVKSGQTETMKISYGTNGNILYKTGVGNYSYSETGKPHAVVSVENADGKISGSPQTVRYNAFGKAETIEDEDSNCKMDIVYGPDGERWSSELSVNGKLTRSAVYAGDYEQITENGVTRDFYYLDGNSIVIKKGGSFKSYVAFTDNLGSVLSVVDENGSKFFDASYNAWGRQTVKLNTIGLHRGYCGHEMLNEFCLINMNGRIYDPVLGSFLSPDNYVQMPDNSQNFNRYSYCLNNPLKYTDPSGNLFGLDDAFVAFALFNMASSMMQASFNGENVWKAGALSLLSSAASYGIGSAFGGPGNFGHELLRAGAHGISSGVFNALDGGNFSSGFMSGASASGIGSYAQSANINTELMLASTTAMGGVAAWAMGENFLQGAIQGMKIGLFNHALHNDDKEIKYYEDQNGNLCGDIPEVECRASRTNSILTTAMTINTVIDCAGVSLKQNGGNSTLGSNYKFYFHARGEREFYGNQYVKTIKLTKIGTVINKGTGSVGILLNVNEIYMGYEQDGLQIGYNTVKATADVIGGWACATAGLKIGGTIGFSIGAIPGSIIGGTIGGIAGSFGGSWLGTNIIDAIYEK